LNNLAIELNHISKVFNKAEVPSLSDISLSFSSGQLIGLVGPDGAGKTTLLRILAGLLKISSGEVKVLGLDPIKQSELLHQNIGYMPQKFGLYEDLTVIQNLSLYADLQNILDHKRAERFSHLLKFTGLEPFTERLAKNLSGGMKQKLGLACVLINKPKLLLLDEPSVGVDPISRRELWNMVTDLIEEHVTVIWSTCYLDEAEKCNNVILLDAGKLIYQGSSNTFTAKLQNKVFLVTPSNSKRDILAKLMQDPFVVDCKIQGDKIRILVKDSIPIYLQKDELVPVTPNFEDAFIETLSNEGKHRHIPTNSVPIDQFEKTSIIEVKNLSKSFNGFKAVDSINFDVKKGEIFGLLGPNGAGKSTTFKMLCGLLKPTNGSTSVMSLSLQLAPSAARSKIGYMAQKFSLYGDLSCLQNLEFFAGIYPLKRNEIKEAISNMVSLFDLKPFLSTSAKDLPLGFKQRLALACCLMHKPQVLFLDEPTSGVDPITRREFWGHINTLVKTGMTVMITTHFMDEAEYCDRIGLINKGKLIIIGSPEELKTMAITPTNKCPTLEDAFIHLSTLTEDQ